MINTELLLAAWLEKLQKKWDTEEYYYDVEEAKKVFKFVSKLTNDRGASRNFDLLEFQFEIITEILCVKRRSDGKRKHREAHINIPRKNGKSFLAAIIVVYLFFCQRHIFGALFILTANTTKQAGELYGTVEHFIKANKTLRRYCKITSSTKTIIRKDNGNKLMVLSSDADNADSFNDYVAVLDEIHQAKNDEMYGKLRTGQGAWDEPLIMTITTASSGEDPANPEMQLYTMAKKIEAGEVNDPSFYYRIYEADKDCNVEDETQWYKSNPALGVFRKLEDLANYAKRIRLMPLQENMFRRMFLNQHVALDHEKGAINMDLWDLCTKKVDTKDLEGWKCWGGLDLSSKNDITGFVLVFYEETTGRFIVVPYLYTPKETVAYRQHKDNNPYEYWIKKGDLIALDGKYVNFERFLDHAVELDEKYRIEQIGFDQWGSTTIINRLEDRWDVIPIGQGTKTMTQVIILTRRMYMYSCASIKGKGGTYCKRKIERAIARKNRKGKTYKNVKHTKYWEALDIKKCYDNILHCFLKFRLIKMFKDKRLLELLFMCIDVYWVKETAAGKRGIPIGTPFGHWFANIMLTPVDFVIKHIFKIKYYFRYMDDMLLFSSNKKKLRQYVACIRDALSRIGLHIKSKLQVHATNDKGKLGNRPIDFIGYRFYRDCTTLRSSICLRITRRIRKVRKKQILNGHDARSVISYYGWIKNTDSWGLKVKYFDDTVKSAKEKISNGSGKNQRRRRDRRGSTDRGGYRWETGRACARTA